MSGTPAAPGATHGTSATGTAAPPAGPPASPAEQLAQLQASLEKGQKELQKFEPLKTALADLTQRIQSLQTAIDGQDAASSAYTDFYRTIAVYRSEVDCFIPTVRCQLDLTEKQKACIRKAIANVDARVKRAQDIRDAHYAELVQKQRRQKKLEDDLAWAKKWNDFFSSGLKTQITKQRDAVKALKALADPSKDACEVWFYLSEMESMLRTARTADTDVACYADVQTLGTFLDCWAPKCYTAAFQQWLVAFNDADAAVKVGASEIAEATKRATDLDKAAADLKSKRTDLILKELKTLDCCGPAAKCS